MFRSSLVLSVCLFLLLGTVAMAAAPSIINVQGRLTDISGNPLPAGLKTMGFRIFDAEAGGTQVWPSSSAEVQFITSSTEGLWTALVGANQPLTEVVFADTVRWLQITVDDGVNPLTTLPRVRLVTGPFAFRVGTVDGAAGGAITSQVAIGPGHTNLGVNTFVAGESNTLDGNYATVAGGKGNVADDDWTTISGGEGNYAGAQHATVGGGAVNYADSSYATVSGGVNNYATGTGATIGGGVNNAAGPNHATVAGGVENRADWDQSFIGGGYLNKALAERAVVAGGVANVASGQDAFVGGGDTDTASGRNAAVVGGERNTASGDYSFVGGGLRNKARGPFSFVGGGSSLVEADSNVARGDFSVVTGGRHNLASGQESTVSGGAQNTATAQGSVVIGGADNYAGGSYSCAAGRRALALHNGCFVWNSNSTDTLRTTDIGQFLITAEGGVGINTDAPVAALHVRQGPNGNGIYLQSGAQDIVWSSTQNLQFGQWDGATFTERARFNGSGHFGINETVVTNVLTLPNLASTEGRGLANAWSTYSSRRWKHDIVPITNAVEIVQQLQGVHYKHNSNNTQDIGLIAEDVGQVLPQVVQFEENGIDARSVDYARLVAVLIEGMKEQQQQIEALTRRVEQLTQ